MDDKLIGHYYSTVTSEAFMDVLAPGSALVIDAMEDSEYRLLEYSNLAERGMVGLVTSGGLADTDEIIAQKIPATSGRGIRPGRNELESVNRPVTIGGVVGRATWLLRMATAWLLFRESEPRKSPKRPCRFSTTLAASGTSKRRARTRGPSAIGNSEWKQFRLQSAGVWRTWKCCESMLAIFAGFVMQKHFQLQAIRAPDIGGAEA